MIAPKCREVVFDCKLLSEANRGGHWAARARRTRALRELVAAQLLRTIEETPQLPAIITLTRIAPRRLDDDNLARAFKSVRDSVADFLLPANRGNQSQRWADDDDERIEWQYRQRKGRPHETSVAIRIETKEKIRGQ